MVAGGGGRDRKGKGGVEEEGGAGSLEKMVHPSKKRNPFHSSFGGGAGGGEGKEGEGDRDTHRKLSYPFQNDHMSLPPGERPS